MRPFLFASIRRSLLLVVLLAVLPALAIVLYTGRELRDNVVAAAERLSHPLPAGWNGSSAATPMKVSTW